MSRMASEHMVTEPPQPSVEHRQGQDIAERKPRLDRPATGATRAATIRRRKSSGLRPDQAVSRETGRTELFEDGRNVNA
jgi:hypothetical protein